MTEGGKTERKCEECIEVGLQDVRGCGYLDKRPDGMTPVWRNKNGSFRYDLQECPLTILSRHHDAVRLAIDWQALESFPLDYNTVKMSMWQRLCALRAESKWLSNQPSQDGD